MNAIAKCVKLVGRSPPCNIHTTNHPLDCKFMA